jgi:hypothetical protein
MERAWARGERVRFMTLTDDSKGAMTVADFYEAWNRLRVRLKKAGLIREFADKTPKVFMAEKKPATELERYVCLAYYLTHVRGESQSRRKTSRTSAPRLPNRR